MDQSKKKFLKNMVGFSMMTWISFLLGFLSSPIATRLFVPEELAKFNMFSHLRLADRLGVLSGAGSGLCAFFPGAAGKIDP